MISAIISLRIHAKGGIPIDDQSKEFIREHLTFYEQLSPEDQQLLFDHTAELVYQQGEAIYNAHHDCIGVLLLKSGELRTYILSEDGRDITLYRLSPGDVCILSASCLLKSITFDVHIDAEAKSEVLLVNSFIYSALQANNIHVENFSLNTAVEKFSAVIWAMEQMLFMRFDRRLATFLQDEMVKTGSPDIKLTHEQIARYMGSAREVVSRMLKHFEEEGILRLYRGGVEILDKDRLRAYL